MKRTLLRSLAAVLLVAACDCDGPATTGSDGLPEVDRVVVDFGRVRIGENGRAELRLVNRGRSLLDINGVDRGETPTVFRVGEPPDTLAAGASTTLTLIFAPEELGAVSGQVEIVSDSLERPRLQVELRGEGVETMVRVTPETVDFGVVEVDSRVARSITLTNEGDITEEIEVLTLADGSPHFSGGPVPGGSNVIRLAPGTSAELPVAFTPRWADRAGFVSSVTLLPCATCSTQTVTLRGVGVDAFLTFDPAECLDFGLVNPGSSLTKTLKVSNLGALDLTLLTGEVTQGGDRFSLGQAFPQPVTGESEHLIPVTYTPAGLNTDSGRLVLTTDDPRQARVELCLKGSGGGPDVLVQPEEIHFGQVAVGAPRTRTFRIANVGQAPAGGTPAPLLVESITVLDGAHTGFSVDFTPFSLGMGESKVVTVTFAPGAEGDVADLIEIATNDADRPLVEVILTGRGRQLAPCQIELVPQNAGLSFGNVDRGRTALLPFAMRNVGPQDCLVDGLALSGQTNPAFTLPTAPPEQFVIQPGDTHSVAVQFRPMVHGSFDGEVRFSISDPAEPNRQVALHGVSVPGCLLVSPNEIDFGVTGAQCLTAERTVNVYNVCGGTVRITGVDLNQDPNQSYRLMTPGVSFPLDLTGSGALAIKVAYNPLRFGEHPAGVFVHSDERPEPYLVSLTGSAQPDAVQRDRFAQEKRPIDILFVIDDSGSMSPYQQSLATNLESFMRFANSQLVDYRIAVTTTDVDTGDGENGRFVPLVSSGQWPAAGASPPRVLTRSTPDVMRAFQTNVSVGIEGSGTERGLEAAYRALSPQNLAGHNAGFLRDDAMLSIIAVTDEAEQSEADLNFYYSYFLSIKGARRANLLSFSAICETDAGNSGNHGGRYIEMAKRTGGIVSSIHTANWARDLEKLGQAAFGYKSRFVLTSTPDESSIEVVVDGRPVPSEDEESRNWWYDPVGNLVEFNPHAIPEPGQSLEVTYSVVCGS